MEQREIDNILNLGEINGINPEIFQRMYQYWYCDSNQVLRASNKLGLARIIDCILDGTPEKMCRCVDNGSGKCSTDACLMRRRGIACSPLCGENCRNQFPVHAASRLFQVIPVPGKGRGFQVHTGYNAGDFITEMTGTFRHVDEMTFERLAYGIRIFNSDFYLENYHAGNFSRHINHSCNSNAEVRVQVVNGEIRLGVYATKAIEPTSEVTRYYGKPTFMCYCNSRHCQNPGVPLDNVKYVLQSRLPRRVPQQHGRPLTSSQEQNRSISAPSTLTNPICSTPISLLRGRRLPTQEINLSPITFDPNANQRPTQANFGQSTNTGPVNLSSQNRRELDGQQQRVQPLVFNQERRPGMEHPKKKLLARHTQLTNPHPHILAPREPGVQDLTQQAYNLSTKQKCQGPPQLSTIAEEPETLPPRPDRPTSRRVPCTCAFFMDKDGNIVLDRSLPPCAKHPRDRPMNSQWDRAFQELEEEEREQALQQQGASQNNQYAGVSQNLYGTRDGRPLNEYGTSDDSSSVGTRRQSISQGSDGQYATSDDSPSPCTNPLHPSCKARQEREKNNEFPESPSPQWTSECQEDENEQEDDTLQAQDCNEDPPSAATYNPNQSGRSSSVDKTLTGSIQQPPLPPASSRPKSSQQSTGADSGTQTTANKLTSTPPHKKKPDQKPPTQKPTNDPKKGPNFPDPKKPGGKSTKNPKKPSDHNIGKGGKGGPKPRNTRTSKQAAGENPSDTSVADRPSKPNTRSKRTRSPTKNDDSNENQREKKRSKKIDNAIEVLENVVDVLREASEDRDPGQSSNGDAPSSPMDDGQRPGTSRPKRSTANPAPRYTFESGKDYCTKDESKGKPKPTLEKKSPAAKKPSSSKGSKGKSRSKGRRRSSSDEEDDDDANMPLKTRLTEALAKRCADEVQPYVPPPRPETLPREEGQLGRPRIYSPGHIFSCIGIKGRETCKYSTTHKPTFERHEKLVHNPDTPFVCPYVLIDECDSHGFKLDQGLVRHLKEVHIDDYPYVCKFKGCGKRFPDADSRQPHHKKCPRNPKNVPGAVQPSKKRIRNRSKSSKNKKGGEEQSTDDTECGSEDESQGEGEPGIIVCRNDGCDLICATYELRRFHERDECDFRDRTNDSAEVPDLCESDHNDDVEGGGNEGDDCDGGRD